MTSLTSLHHRDGHLGWDRSIPPVLEVASGDEVELTLADCFAGQLTGDATAADVAAPDLDGANPLTGPIRVAGAQAGDVLAVEILEVEVGETGWTTLIPGFGLLADEFPDPHVIVSDIGPDLYEGACAATRAMIEHLGRVHDLSPADAYALCSVAGNLRIVEVVDEPNWVVALDLDTSVVT